MLLSKKFQMNGKEYEVVKDGRIANAVFRKYAKEKNIENELWLDSRFKYIETERIMKDVFTIDYGDYRYEEKYFDGCFNPFLVRCKIG